MQPWVGRLGMTLLHFLWQGAIVAAIYAAARRWGARALDANGRYLLACSALTAMAIAPAVTWILLRGPSPESVAVSFAEPISSAQIEPARSIALSLPADADSTVPGPFFFWVVAFWLIGATAFSLRMLAGGIFAERLRSSMVRPAPAEWQVVLDRLKARICVSRPVRLLVSGRVQAPAVIGWLRPIVLAPVGALAGLPAAQVEALLLHELAHIRRHDYLIHILQSAVEAVFFYHPAVWWISGHMRAERELCCDDIAVSVTGDAVVYARALAEFDSARWVQPTVMAANGGLLADRIGRLLGRPSMSRRPPCGPGTAATLILLAIGTCVVFAQSNVRPPFTQAPSLPAFDAVSVKPFVPTGPWRRIPQVNPKRLYIEGCTPMEMIVYAYGINYNQLDRLPDWAQRQYFQVVGVTDEPTTHDQMLLMLRRVLAERFQFAFTDTDAMQPVDALVVSPRGLKMKPSTSDSDCGHGVITFDRMKGVKLPPNSMVPFAGCTVAELVKSFNALRRQSGRPVIDKTGLTGQYSMLIWQRRDECQELPGGGNHCDNVETFEDAVKRELGLELVKATARYRVLHTTKITQPSAN